MYESSVQNDKNVDDNIKDNRNDYTLEENEILDDKKQNQRSKKNSVSSSMIPYSKIGCNITFETNVDERKQSLTQELYDKVNELNFDANELKEDDHSPIGKEEFGILRDLKSF